MLAPLVFRVRNLLAFIFLCSVCCASAAGYPQGRSYKQNNDVCSFVFAWDVYKIGFDVGLADTLREINKIRPWTQLSPQERRDLYEAMPPSKGQSVQMVQINYPKRVKESQGALSGLAKALKLSAPQKDDRSLAIHALRFVQSIPYSTKFSNKADYQTPVGILVENRGDCDSKSVLLAGILANWGIDTIFIQLRDHMLLGICVPSFGDERVIRLSGQEFAVAETTITGWKLGSAAPNVLQQIKSGRFATVRDPEEGEEAYRRDLATKIEEAKRRIAQMNRILIGKPAAQADVLRKLDRETLKCVQAEISGGRLASFGTYPDPRTALSTTDVMWYEVAKQ